MEKIIVTDLKGTRFLLDVAKAKELGIIEKEIKPLWYPKQKETYYYCSDGFLPKEATSINSPDTLGRKQKGNVYQTLEQCKIANGYIKADINQLILKFAIENDCLAMFEDFINADVSELFCICFNRKFGGYIPCTLEGMSYVPHTVILTDGEKADKLAAIINNQELGYIKKENFEEKSIELEK